MGNVLNGVNIKIIAYTDYQRYYSSYYAAVQREAERRG